MSQDGKTTSISVDATQDASSFVAYSIKWLYDMEAVDNPVVIQDLYLRIYGEDPRIQDVDLLMDKYGKKMLIYIRLSLLGRMFKSVERKSVIGVLDRVQKVLPRFSFRVITDRKLFDLALERIKQGVKHEKASSNTGPSPADSGNAKVSESPEHQLQQASDLLPDKTEQSKPE